MQISKARPLAGGVQSLMYVGDAPTTAMINLPLLAVAGGALWYGVTGQRPAQGIATIAGALLLLRAVR